jgi:hypothetical protein
MRCSYVVPMRWMVIYEYEVQYQEGPSTYVLLNNPDNGHDGNLHLQGMIPMAEPGIELATS